MARSTKEIVDDSELKLRATTKKAIRLLIE